MTEREEQSRPPRRFNPHRGRPHQTRVYPHLGGVRDLREIIDRKRSERGTLEETHEAPLEDPARDQSPKRVNRGRNKTTNNSFRRVPQQNDIENPLNIKIEFSTSTGEHSYKVDESTVLPTIKHVPDHAPRSRPFRGRGRGRGRGRSYQNRTRNHQKQGESPVEVPAVATGEEESWDQEVLEQETAVEEELEKLKIGDENEENRDEGVQKKIQKK